MQRKLSDKMLVWLSVWNLVHIVCIWSSWCHCHPKTLLSFATFKSRLILSFWYRLNQVVLEKRPLNRCSCCSISYIQCRCVRISVLWRCWLGSRKGIRPVKNWVVGCWHGYLSGASCRLAYGPADATATYCLASVKSRLVLPFWYRLTRVVPEKGPLNGCNSSSISYIQSSCVSGLTFVVRASDREG